MSHDKHTKKHPAGEGTADPLDAKNSETEILKKDLEEVRKQLADTQKDFEEMKDKLFRTAADFDNARKRLAKEKEEYVRFANERFIKGLLPIIDNFERAMLHADGSESALAAFKDGVALIKKQLTDFLKSQGLVRMETVGKKFDPHFHEAVGHILSDEHPEETVLEELEAGYLLEGRLLRPAKVRISQAGAADAQPEKS